MDITDEPMDVDMDDHSQQILWVPPPSHSESSTGLYDFHTDAEGLWVIHHWKPTSNAHIESFHNRWPPSRTSACACVWIAIDCGISPLSRALGSEEYEAKFKRDVEGLRREFAHIVGSHSSGTGEGGGKVTPEMVDTLAVKYGVLSGKWLVYTKPDQVDELWRKVVRVVAAERGHGQAKVSARKVIENVQQPPTQSLPSDEAIEWDGGTPEPSEGHVICVYVEDYMNKRGVDELRKALRFRAGVFWKIGFKSDAYTYLGIYKNNPWGLRPSRYHDSDHNTGGRFGKGLN